jgi:hypothetical protein
VRMHSSFGGGRGTDTAGIPATSAMQWHAYRVGAAAIVMTRVPATGQR